MSTSWSRPFPPSTGLISGGKLKALAVTGPGARRRAARRADGGGGRRAGLRRVGLVWTAGAEGIACGNSRRKARNAAARTALQRPELLARVKDDGAARVRLAVGREFAAFMAAERKRWGEVIRDANITLNQ